MRMATLRITVNLPEDLARRLEERASLERRSLANAMVWLAELGLGVVEPVLSERDGVGRAVEPVGVALPGRVPSVPKDASRSESTGVVSERDQAAAGQPSQKGGAPDGGGEGVGSVNAPDAAPPMLSPRSEATPVSSLPPSVLDRLAPDPGACPRAQKHRSGVWCGECGVTPK